MRVALDKSLHEGAPWVCLGGEGDSVLILYLWVLVAQGRRDLRLGPGLLWLEQKCRSMLPAREPETPGRHSPGGIVCRVILGRDVMPLLYFRSASNLRHPVGPESVETSLLIEDVLQYYRAVRPKLRGLELHIQLSSQQSVLSRRQRGRLQLQARDR